MQMCSRAHQPKVRPAHQFSSFVLGRQKYFPFSFLLSFEKKKEKDDENNYKVIQLNPLKSISYGS